MKHQVTKTKMMVHIEKNKNSNVVVAAGTEHPIHQSATATTTTTTSTLDKKQRRRFPSGSGSCSYGQYRGQQHRIKLIGLLLLAVVGFLLWMESFRFTIVEEDNDGDDDAVTVDANNNIGESSLLPMTKRERNQKERTKTKKSNKTKKTSTIQKKLTKKKKVDPISSDSAKRIGGATSSSSSSSSSSSAIRQISILGERNSGTRWTWDHVSNCFNHSIPVVKELTRYKHWFQYPNASKYPHDTLVLAQFRNPFDWLKAMQHVPHHAPMHYNLSWKEFLTKPWTMPRVGLDLEMQQKSSSSSKRSKNNYEMTLCQEEFFYKDIVSCAIEPLPKESYDHVIRFSEHQPFYEMNMDGSGRPYPNILQFRSDKILNMLQVKDYEGVADVWVLQYEYLLAKGTTHLIQSIQRYTGIEPHCQPYPKQYRPTRPVTKAFAKHVNRHLNWTVEAMIGYATDIKREEKWD